MQAKRNTAQLLLHCPDKPGILAEVTNFITINKGNIIYLDQYVDRLEIREDILNIPEELLLEKGIKIKRKSRNKENK